MIACYDEFKYESFIPIQHLLSVCVYGNCTVSFDSNVTEMVLVVSPLNSKHLYF